MSARQVRDLKLETKSGTFAVRRATIREELSTPTSATVELRVHSDPGLGGFVDGDVRLVFLKDSASAREIALRVRAARFLGHRDGLLAFELDLQTKFWFLKLSKNTRKFRDLSARDIVSQVLASKVDFRFENVRQPWPLPYVVQYEELDFDFVSRLLEQEGMYYVVEDDGSLVIGDQSSAAEKFAPHAPLSLISAHGALTHGDEGLIALRRGTRVGSGRATVNDYHWKTPNLRLLESASGKRDQALENYDYPTGYRLPDQGKTLAQIRVESFEARKRFLRGETTFIALRPGRSISVDHADGISFGGDHFIIATKHEFHHAANEEATLKNEFEAIPKSVPFRPAIRTPKPEIGGYDTAMVRGPQGEEIHTDEHGRCKVQFHWDREAKGTDEDSRWLRVVQETSSSMTLARVGWEVAVQYVHSDPDRPLVIGRLINGQMVPMYGQPAHQNVMCIRTESYPGKKGYNEIRIDDTSGAQQIYVRAEQQQLVVIEHDRREWIGHDERYKAIGYTSRRVDKNQQLDVGDDLDVHVGEDKKHGVKVNRQETIGGNERITADGAISLDVRHNETEIVGSVRTTIAGGIKPPKIQNPVESVKGAIASAKPNLDPKGMLQNAAQDPANAGASLKSSLQQSIPTPEALKGKVTGALQNAVKPPSLENMLTGTISRVIGGTLKRTVGGAMIALAGEGISESVNKVLAEVIGGLRLQMAKQGDANVTSSGNFIRFIGGMVLKKAGKEVSHSANTSTVTIAGNADFKAKDNLEIRGQTITIEAKKRVRLEKNGLSIEMTPGKINIAGSLKLTSKDRIQVKGAPDNVTKD